MNRPNGRGLSRWTGAARGPSRAIIFGLERPAERGEGFSGAESLDELGLLVETWGGLVVGKLTQTRGAADPAYYVGRGKLVELIELARAREADMLVADDELTPVQLRNIEEELRSRDLDARVLDRTEVILEIFARRASSREGRLEVELARAVWRLPRLRGKGPTLSRLGGGVGTRGPGETRLEMDRRRLRERIRDLRREIAEVGRQRAEQAKSRREALVPVIALVGYTNAGKSSLFRRLTGADVLVDDRLFATLDPVVRRVVLPDKRLALVSDTVGFIRKLPHHLVAAFRATLDEVRGADVLVHVVDVSNPAWPVLVAAAETVLARVRPGDSLGAGAELVWVLNKTDLLPGGRGEALGRPEARELLRRGKVVAVSAATGEGCRELLEVLAAALRSKSGGKSEVFSLLVPYDQAALLPEFHRRGRVLSERYSADGVRIEVEMDVEEGRRLVLLAGAGDGPGKNASAGDAAGPP